MVSLIPVNVLGLPCASNLFVGLFIAIFYQRKSGVLFRDHQRLELDWYV